MELQYFTHSNWDKVKEVYKKYWSGELRRPIIPFCIAGAKLPKRKMPSAPLLSFATSADKSVKMKDYIDRFDYELSTYEYLGDSYPLVPCDAFGPGIAGAFLGAEVEAMPHTVWFHVSEPKDIRDLHFEYASNNFWLDRMREFYSEGVKLWQGEVIISMPDLGGMLDILAIFRTTEGLLMDLYDYPQEVLRCTKEIMHCWFKYFDEFNAILAKGNPHGYTDWSTLFTFKPGYVMQSDFSYMISPQMFKEFVLWEIEYGANRLDKSIYHLDGIGELPHLDMLLMLKDLDVIQWVAGASAPKGKDWSEVYEAIENSGKLLHSYDFETSPITNALKRKGALAKRQIVFDTSMREYALNELKLHGFFDK